MELIDSILEERNVRQALEQVIRNGGASGVDGMSVETLRVYMSGHYAEIKHLSRLGSTAPGR